MKMVKLLYMVSMAFFFVSCLTMEPNEYDVVLYNNTEDELYILTKRSYGQVESYMKIDSLYRDSSLITELRAKANMLCYIGGWDRDPQDFIKSTDTLTIFILDKEEYEGKTWSQIVDSAHFRQIYHLSGDDIRLLNARVPYPPTEAMRNMDMVPSYENAVK